MTDISTSQADPRPASRVQPLPRRGGRTILRPIALTLFFLVILLSVGAVRLMVGGFPVRAIVALLLVGLLVLNDPGVLNRVIREHPRALLAIILFMLIGALVSLANGETVASTAQQLLEIHVQALVGIIICNAMVRLCGLKAVAFTLIGVALTTIAVAFGQWAGVEPAWALRRWIGALQHDGPLTQLFYIRRDRTMGISLSPVHLGTQTCLAFAAFFIYMARNRSFLSSLRLEMIFAVLIAVTACLVSGNRSPLLGVVAFVFAYLAAVNRSLFLLACTAAIVALPSFSIVQGVLQEMGLRIASTDDGSAEGRGVLANYGVRLFLDNPLGYGLGFNSTDLWADYWEYLQYANNSQVVKTFTLHNYFLLMLNKYGIATLMVLPILLPRSRKDWTMLLAFVPYFFHVAFHNDGPLQADFLIWYIIPLGRFIAGPAPTQGPANTGQAAWRRYLPTPTKDAPEMTA